MQTPRLPATGYRLVLPALMLLSASVRAEPAAGADTPGAAIYRQRCASCHGAKGEGTEDYPRPLAGDRTVAQLSRLIARTMPEDDPGTCVGPDADAVASYIHEAFYAKAARAGVKPPRVELSRLTVRQYANTVADLVGAFRAPAPAAWGEPRGLRGEYFKSRRFRDSDRVIDRTDPEVKFDFGTESPDPEAIEDPSQFSIRWRGSVLAPESGEYEFVVRSEHAVRLWVNDLNRPLIDATVRSGGDTEHREAVRLLGGRAYPVRLEFSKAKQGVDDSKKKKAQPTPATVSLEWKRPHRPVEVIPARNLTPDAFPETFVVTTPFPPDDRSAGYERGTSVSKSWDQATTDAAIETANYLLAPARLRELAGVGDGLAGDARAGRLRGFAETFVARAFRRPLTAEQSRLYVGRQFDEAGDPDAALTRVILLALKSPRFLYRETGDGPYDVASRLSFGLWDAPPDAALLEAAAAGKLGTRDEVKAQAARMAGDLRTRSKVREFLLQWLKVEDVPDIAKDPALYPGFDEAVASDLRTSLELFLDDVVWGDRPDFRRLLLGEEVYLNGRLSAIYGGGLPADAPFQKVTIEPEARAGVLSHPYLLATFAYTSAGSPIHRGVFVARSLLGRGLRPPPVAVAPLAPDLHAGLSTRERVALQTSPAQCMTCHGMVNPLGFALEHFDAVGRYRTEEKGRPVDASGVYEPPAGEPVQFAGARDLAAALASSGEAHTAFVAQLFHYLVKQPVDAFGLGTLPALTRSFADDGFDVRHLIVEIVAASTPAAAAPKP